VPGVEFAALLGGQRERASLPPNSRFQHSGRVRISAPRLSFEWSTWVWSRALGRTDIKGAPSSRLSNGNDKLLRRFACSRSMRNLPHAEVAVRSRRLDRMEALEASTPQKTPSPSSLIRDA
jgi:hypothetical protein